ncbi:MAG: 2-hydroxycyclohexanecarboxyl-CoA dehydrogenase [Solirubrobacteraceae bacterium]|nr:2-hydroxycyclohexanecarboxyl-CoA dehydrogenase [Solirubrobacteraceae bacterium]
MTDFVVKDFPDMGVAVAGGTAGIGRASARALLLAGVPRVVILGRSEQRGQDAIAYLQGAAPEADVSFVAADCRSPQDAARAVGVAEERLGGIDVLVNSIAPTEVIPELLLDIAPEQIEPLLAAQAVPPMLMTRLVLPLMVQRRGGVIVNVSSDAAKTATPGESVVGAGTSAIKTFSQAAALEAKRHGVRINAITPSLVAGTEGTDRITAGETFSAKLFAKVASMAHLGVSTADDQGALVVYIASPAAARLTGQAISLNGGISAA